MSTQLALAAYQQGRAAAETYRREGRPQPPALLGPSAPPVSLTKVLLDAFEQPTDHSREEQDPPCPGCGGYTDDPAGGPCSICWQRTDEAEHPSERARADQEED